MDASAHSPAVEPWILSPLPWPWGREEENHDDFMDLDGPYFAPYISLTGDDEIEHHVLEFSGAYEQNSHLEMGRNNSDDAVWDHFLNSNQPIQSPNPITIAASGSRSNPIDLTLDLDGDDPAPQPPNTQPLSRSPSRVPTPELSYDRHPNLRIHTVHFSYPDGSVAHQYKWTRGGWRCDTLGHEAGTDEEITTMLFNSICSLTVDVLVNGDGTTVQLSYSPPEERNEEQHDAVFRGYDAVQGDWFTVDVQTMRHMLEHPGDRHVVAW